MVSTSPLAAEYRAAWLPGDIIAGVTLAAYAIPVSLLCGTCRLAAASRRLRLSARWSRLRPARIFASARHRAHFRHLTHDCRNSGAMAEGDAQRYAQIASLAAFTVAALCLFAWLLRLSALVKLISDSILVGFKAGAGLTIAMTQLPSLFGVKGGGHNFFDRACLLAGQLGQMHYFVLIVGVIAIGLLVFGERLLPGKPVALGVVALSIVAATCWGFRRLGCQRQEKFRRAYPPWQARLSGYAMSRE